MVDSEGYRFSVGIVLANSVGQLLWARRIDGDDIWQFPQGGIKFGETKTEALFRELEEELGLKSEHVEVLESTAEWLRYKFPTNLIRRDSYPICIGQKQRWFLLRLLADENSIDLNFDDQPEFDCFRWVDYWYPVKGVVEFKKAVYRQVLEILENPLNLALAHHD